MHSSGIGPQQIKEQLAIVLGTSNANGTPLAEYLLFPTLKSCLT
jgi:hypothetical protein